VFGSLQLQLQMLPKKPVMCRGRLTLKVKQKVGSMVDEIFFGERKIKAAGGPHDRDASEEDTRT
jgi:hypothetical protein